MAAVRGTPSGVPEFSLSGRLTRVQLSDLEHFANAAHMLIQDGCDALDALGWKLDKTAR
jgi:hypothetical protein